jgi:hypothetical protein
MTTGAMGAAGMTTGSMGISPMAAVEGASVAGTVVGTTTGISAGLTATLGACGCVDGGMIELLDLHSGPRRCSGRSLAQSA